MTWVRIEANAYWTLFTVALVAVAVWEMVRPWRSVSGQLVRRWRNHALLVVAASALGMLVYRGSLVMVAVTFNHSKYGLLNKPWLPLALRCIIAFVLLDLLAYAVHRAFHAVPLLWRVHQVHHSDPDLDLSTGFRNHPLEALILQSAYLGAIVLLAPPPVAVLAVQLAAILSAFFTHANATLPSWVDRPLRLVLVTPEMHRVHHSDQVSEQTANFAEILPWWDRLLGTYLEAPAAGQDGIRTGLQGIEDAASAGFLFMLTQPFRRAVTEAESLPNVVQSRAVGD